MKVFSKLDTFDESHHFEPWLKRILVNASIDYYRKAKKHYFHEDVSTAVPLANEPASPLGSLSHDELLGLVNRLPAAYRMVLNLHVI